ncbi:MAG: 2-phosphosulfolactate phosphatase [Dethiobacter sp.]|jgi:2-phosphosulfolactate phosphatase|nr:2-phosphosulfolactate phosphatase [Dethiobacter sp.]
MFIDIILVQEQIASDDIKERIAVVIDTLRATSTIITALGMGCREVIPVSSPAEAINLKKKALYSSYLLGGEIEGNYIESFQLGNSPVEYANTTLRGKGLILTTTNGTHALQKAKKSDMVIVCALLNAKAVSDWLSRQEKDLVICCAGTRGNYSLEDFLTAGRLVNNLIEKNSSFRASDLALTSACFYKSVRFGKDGKNGLPDMVKGSVNGERLCRSGFEEDVKYCAQEDIYTITPIYINGSIKPV